jgi:cation transporter-like permease
VDEELKGVSFVTQILRNTAAIFTLTVLVISIAGMVFARYDPSLRETSSLFALAPLGLSYNTILQIAGGSVILAIISTFLFSEQFFYKMRFLLRIVIFLSMTLIIFSLFAIIFNWFPVNESVVWLRFFISTLVCFLISIGLTLVKHKLEGKKYNKLLESYKARHNISQ